MYRLQKQIKIITDLSFIHNRSHLRNRHITSITRSQLTLHMIYNGFNLALRYIRTLNSYCP